MANITCKIYCDESRTTQSRWMLIGGIWIPSQVEVDFEKACANFRLKDNRTIHAFFKWTKVSLGMLELYKNFINIFFDFPIINFRCIAIDTHKLDYSRWHKGDKELAFYKFYYQLLSRNMVKNERYLVLVHRRLNRKENRLNDLKTTINTYLNTQEEIVANVEPRDARLHNPLQMVDVFLGAIGYQWEGYTTSPAKLEVSRYIAQKALGQNEFLPTSKSTTKFNIWELELKE